MMEVQDMFPPHDVAALFTAGHGHVEIPLRRLPHARLLWLNQRAMRDDPAFLAAGASAQAYGEWLLDRCAYAMADAGCAGAADATGVADRYGGTGIGHNGGSGRAAYVHGDQVKGVGRTPLVSVLTDELHGSGGAYLEECVREAICAELVAAEFPTGAVPVLAIIETGEVQVWETEHGPKQERRCLLVRPAFLRPAHFERAPGFISTDPKEGAKDAARVRQTWAAALATYGADRMLAAYRQFWPRWSAQLAYAFAYRLPHGGNTSSNIALDGRLLDFGAMAAMPSWARISTMIGGAPVGMDMQFLVQALQAQCVFWGRHVAPQLAAPQQAGALLQAAGAVYQDTLYVEVLRVLGLSRAQSRAVLDSAAGEAIRQHLNRLLGRFQREQFTIFDGTPEPLVAWDVSWLWSDTPPPHLQPLRALLQAAHGAAGAAGTAALRTLAARCKLRSLNRTGMYRDTAKETVYAALEGAAPGEQLTPRRVAEFIDEYVVRNRRDSRHEPGDAAPVGFAGNGTAAYALFYCFHEQRHFAVCEWHEDAAQQAEPSRLWLTSFDSRRLEFLDGSQMPFVGAVFVH